MKTIFVYGFMGYKNQSKCAERILDNLICFEYNSKLEQSIKEIARELDFFINSKTSKTERVNLLGISAGGIISDYYGKFVNPKKVSKIATVCSPFKGSYLTIFFTKKRRGLKELSYNSDFLRDLNSKKLDKDKIINFYSFFDYLVPFNSGKGENPKHTWDFFHFRVDRDKRILRKVKRFFEKRKLY